MTCNCTAHQLREWRERAERAESTLTETRTAIHELLDLATEYTDPADDERDAIRRSERTWFADQLRIALRTTQEVQT